MTNWVEQGDELFLLYAASTAPTSLTGFILVEDNDEQVAPTEIFIPNADITADRTLIVTDSKVIGKTGKVVSASIGGNASALKRGQLYAMLVVSHRSIDGNDVLCKGYVYGSNPVGLGEYVEAPEGKGFIVTNEADSTLVNNTALTRTITVPTNARWAVHGGRAFNADDVTRNIEIVATDGTNEIARYSREAVATTGVLAYPNANSDQDAGQYVHLSLTEAFEITITWEAGGASAGGTARSSAVVEEWIEL